MKHFINENESVSLQKSFQTLLTILWLEEYEALQTYENKPDKAFYTVLDEIGKVV